MAVTRVMGGTSTGFRQGARQARMLDDEAEGNAVRVRVRVPAIFFHAHAHAVT